MPEHLNNSNHSAGQRIATAYSFCTVASSVHDNGCASLRERLAKFSAGRSRVRMVCMTTACVLNDTKTLCVTCFVKELVINIAVGSMSELQSMVCNSKADMFSMDSGEPQDACLSRNVSIHEHPYIL
jgi:hypothetical protein